MVQIKVNEGVLEGELVNNEYGGKFYSFKGIPYAQPPVEELRFKAPQPPKPWEGIRSAKQFGPICPQYNVLTKSYPENANEDCLYLNVYTPKLSPIKPLPVMVWIHGGGFTFGSGDDDFYGPQFLIRQNVILVTFNYRLEVLGFLCLDSENVPGNAGMKDQVAALRWVKNNIKSFGGDPDNVTIFGESAGSGSVTYHLISPMSKGLFRRAIAQSGAATCSWAQSIEAKERAIALARNLGFSSRDDKQLYEFFKSQPVEKLLGVHVSVIYSEAANLGLDVLFSIVSEDIFGKNEPFFHGDVADALRKGIHEEVDVICGYTEHEGLLALSAFQDYKKMIEQAINYPEFFVPKLIKLYCPIKDQLDVGRKIRDHHFSDGNISLNTWKKFERVFALETFVYGIWTWAKICAAKKRNKIYMYKFTCKSERNIVAHLLGLGEVVGSTPTVSHADDIFYIFNNKIIDKPVDMNSRTFRTIENVTKLWTNFAKYGNPTPDNSLEEKWIPFCNEEQHCLIIDEKLVMCKAPDREDVDFLENLHKKYLPRYAID